ncbi:MAG TPA: sialidase family protein [Polyangia bacterium]|nr:sialidase family protein [Polyangia bacterium]
MFVAVCAARSGPARANGAFPDSDAVLLPANRPQQIILSTNFGLIISDDDGATWQWTCERPETSMASTYVLGAAPAERIYARSPDVGLALSDDVACSWRRAGGALAGEIATDVFPDPSDAMHVLAIVGAAADAGLAGDAVYESFDGGATFAAAPLYVAAAGEQLVGVEIARSDARVIYVAIVTPGPHATLARSDDGGANWMRYDLQPSIGARTARIVAVDPADANVIFLRAIGGGSELLAISRDGGLNIATPITFPGGTLSAFARLASGTVLVAGLLPADAGATIGVAWRSSDGGATFQDWTLAPMPRLRALAERDGKLYLAASNYSDGWALAMSTDEGRTLQPIARYDQVSAVKTCVAAACQDSCDEQAGRKIWAPEVCNPSARDAAVDAGSPPNPSSGCGCATGAPRGGAGIAALIAFAMVLLRVGSRRALLGDSRRGRVWEPSQGSHPKSAARRRRRDRSCRTPRP